MREWNLSGSSPLSLLMTPNLRMCQGNSDHCHAWELSMGDASRPYIGIHSTLSLQVIDLSLSLGFSQENTWLFDPSDFYSAPIVKKFSINYFQVKVSPFKGIDTIFDFYIPQSCVVAGRITLINNTDAICNIASGLFGNLVTRNKGNPISIKNIDMVNFLQGSNGGTVFPTIMMNAGPSSAISPKTGLYLPMRILPQDSRTILWACSTAETPKLSLELCQNALKQNWEKEIARIEHNHDATILDINCSNVDWDAIFTNSQIFAQQFLIQSKEKKMEGFFQHRSPDTSYPNLGEKMLDIPSLLLFNQLSSTLLPADPQPIIEITSHLLEKLKLLLDSSHHEYHNLPLPILAQIVNRVALYHPCLLSDRNVFDTITAYIDVWFNEANDRNQDLLLKLSNVSALSLDYSIIDDLRISPADDGRTTAIESPALEALLITELETLMNMADQFGADDVITACQSRINNISLQFKTMTQSKQPHFTSRDGETHTTLSSRQVGELCENGTKNLEITLDPPQNLTVIYRAKETFQKVINIPWNILIIQRLIHCGQNASAISLFQKLMHLQVLTLSKYHTFFDFYDHETAEPLGHSHSLSGLIPVSLFLELIGIQITSPGKVIISGEYPLTHPVSIKYRGLQISRSVENTNVVMPNGKTFRISDTGIHTLTQD